MIYLKLKFFLICSSVIFQLDLPYFFPFKIKTFTYKCLLSQGIKRIYISLFQNHRDLMLEFFLGPLIIKHTWLLRCEKSNQILNGIYFLFIWHRPSKKIRKAMTKGLFFLWVHNLRHSILGAGLSLYFSDSYHICSTEMSFLSKDELLMGWFCADSLVHIWGFKMEFYSHWFLLSLLMWTPKENELFF